MRVIYKPEDQQMITQYESLMEDRLRELIIGYLGTNKSSIPYGVYNQLQRDPLLVKMRNDLDIFIMTRTEVMYSL